MRVASIRGWAESGMRACAQGGHSSFRSRLELCVLAFDATNAFNTMPRQVVLDAVAKRLPALGVVVNSWLGAPTSHTFWQSNGETGEAIDASAGVDQGCPLSPALFAIGLADALDNINTRLGSLTASCRVFSYLDDIVIAVPSEHAFAASKIAVEELNKAGLVVNEDKTAAWTKDPAAPLPPVLASCRFPHVKVSRCHRAVA